MLASDRRLPIYLRIQDTLAADIAAGKWRPGEAIPAEEALAKRFGAAVGTARKAIEGLVAQGRLERHQGRGTFVRRADFGNMLFRFFRHTHADGTPLRPTAKLLARRKSKADAATARRLAIPAGTSTIELFRLRLIEGAPMLAEEIVVPYRRFAPLLDLAKDAFGDLLYPLYETACGQIVVQAREHLRFGQAPAHIAKALCLAPKAPVAIVERTVFAADRHPLEFRVSYGAAERFSYTIDIK